MRQVKNLGLKHFFVLWFIPLMQNQAIALNHLTNCISRAKRTEINCLAYMRSKTRIKTGDKVAANKIRKQCETIALKKGRKCLKKMVLEAIYELNSCAYYPPKLKRADKPFAINPAAVKCWTHYWQQRAQCTDKINRYKSTHSYKHAERVKMLEACRKQPEKELLACGKAAIPNPLSYPLLDRPMYDTAQPWGTDTPLKKGTQVMVCITNKRKKPTWYRGRYLGESKRLTPVDKYINKKYPHLNFKEKRGCVRVTKPRRIKMCVNMKQILPLQGLHYRYPTKKSIEMRARRLKILAVLKENHDVIRKLADAIKAGVKKQSLNALSQIQATIRDEQNALSGVKLSKGDLYLNFNQAYLGEPLLLKISPIPNYKNDEVFYNCEAESKTYNKSYLPDICRFKANYFHYHFID